MTFARAAATSGALGAFALAAVVLCGGCDLIAGKREGGSPYTCVCTYLSEQAQAARREFTVCAVNDHEANAVARGCQGPGDIEGCTCQQARAGTACQSGCSR